MAKKTSYSTTDLERKFADTAFQVNQERSDFLLPQLLDFVARDKWINLRPEYQRRLVWDNKKKSRFIESLLLNIPIPPVFLYECDLNRYEVMDGQQRLNSVIDFYDNRLALSGLETWKELNGRRYGDCPERIRRGLDRRRISATVLMLESTDPVDTSEIRRLVFERLNTGGQTLNAQELRNCLYSSKFNDLLTELAGYPLFNDIWGVPRYKDHLDRDGSAAPKLANNNLYRRMTDCELVLRFFAFRRRSKVKGAVKRILDACMEDYQKADSATIDELREVFISRIELASKIFGDWTFKYEDDKGTWRRSQPLYDAVMIALDGLWDDRGQLIQYRARIRDSVWAILEDEDAFEVIVGRPNTAAAIRERVDVIADAIVQALP